MGNVITSMEGMSNVDMGIRLARLQLIVTCLLSVNYIGVLFGIAFTLVTGYSLVTTTTGVAYPHAIWLLGPATACIFGFLSTRFDVGLYVDTIVWGSVFYYSLYSINCFLYCCHCGICVGV